MPKTAIITSPITGLKMKIRRWKLRDMEHLAELADAADDGVDILSEAVKPCWIETLDAGIYPAEYVKVGTASAPDWSQLLKTDVLYSVFGVRIASWPDDSERGMTPEHYQFDVECKYCQPKYSFQQQVRLTQLKFLPLPKASAEAIGARRPLECRGPDGKLIKFELPKLAQDRDLVEFRNKKAAKGKAKGKAKPSELLAAQTTFIEGLKTQSMTDRVRFFAELDLADLVPIRNEMSKAGSYVAQNVDCKCPKCNATFAVKLPLQANFFMPSDPMEESPPEIEEAPEEQDPEEQDEEESH